MAHQFSGSNYLTGTTPITGYPFSLSCWVYPANGAAFGPAFGLSQPYAGGGGVRASIILRGDIGGDPVFCYMWDTTSGTKSRTAQPTTGFTAGVWNHVLAVYESGTTTAYLNGGSVGINNNNVTGGVPDASGLTQTNIAIYTDTSSAVYLTNGSRVAECAVWRVALSAGNARELAAGFTPDQIRPDKLTSYYRLMNGDGDRDYWRGNNLTAIGSPIYADHPRTIERSRPFFMPRRASAPPPPAPNRKRNLLLLGVG